MIDPALFLIPGSMAVALAADSLFGEPPRRLHPVVWMGTYLGGTGRRLPELSAGAAFAAGALAWLGGASLAGAIAWGIGEGITAAVVSLEGWGRVTVAALVTGFFLKPMLAWRNLREEVATVEGELAKSLGAGRVQVARLAGRDPSSLSATEVRETAIESLAENLNDSVVAPLFWFAVAGLPGAAIYRFANTADAMWGTRGRWEWAGKWAARADDVLSFVPARLAAALLVPWVRWRELGVEARRTVSPNAGWPMAAMALRLGVRLGRPGVYTLNAAGRAADATDTSAGIARARLAVLIAWIFLSAAALLRPWPL